MLEMTISKINFLFMYEAYAKHMNRYLSPKITNNYYTVVRLC